MLSRFYPTAIDFSRPMSSTRAILYYNHKGEKIELQPLGKGETMSPASIEMETVARAYCTLIETADPTDEDWLERMAAILPRLHAAIAALGDADVMDHSMSPDLDARFELFAELREMLGKRDSYWMQFDVA